MEPFEEPERTQLRILCSGNEMGEHTPTRSCLLVVHVAPHCLPASPGHPGECPGHPAGIHNSFREALGQTLSLRC